MFLPATLPGSPASRVAPNVVPVTGNVDNAPDHKSLMGENVTAMTMLPFAPFAPSTCRLYNIPGLTLKMMQLAPGEPPVVQLSLLATGVRAYIAAPV